MTQKKSFWRQSNVIGGLSLAAFSYLSIVVLAIAWPDAYALLIPQMTVKIGAYSATLNQIGIFVGLLWLLWPKIGPTLLQFIRNRIGVK